MKNFRNFLRICRKNASGTSDDISGRISGEILGEIYAEIFDGIPVEIPRRSVIGIAGEIFVGVSRWTPEDSFEIIFEVHSGETFGGICGRFSARTPE